jgi:cadmium resistance protein CadD (predicted permease)
VTPAGLPAVLGLAAGAFAGTNVDNAVVTVAMVAAAPPERARRIAAGQVAGFTVIVLASIGMAALLFEIPTRVIGLLGLVPFALGVRGLLGLRHAEGRSRLAKRAVGSGFFAASLVTIGAGGDNLAVYIPLLRVLRVAGTVETLLLFAACEVLLTLLILRAGGHPRVRAGMTAFGVFAAPLLFCAIGILVLVEAGTFSFLR